MSALGRTLESSLAKFLLDMLLLSVDYNYRIITLNLCSV